MSKPSPKMGSATDKVIQYLLTLGPGAELSRTAISEFLQKPLSQVTAIMHWSVCNGLTIKRIGGVEYVQYSLPPEAFLSDGRDAAWDEIPIVQRTVPAATAPRLMTRAVPSVFHLAQGAQA